MQAKLPRNPKTDMPANRHERCAGGVSNVPICSDPKVQAGPQTDITRDAREQRVPTTSVLSDSRNAVILHVEASKRRAYKPFMSDVVRLIGSVGQPKARDHIGP